MTDVQTERAPKRAKRDKVHRVADDIVSGSSLATHLGPFTCPSPRGVTRGEMPCG